MARVPGTGLLAWATRWFAPATVSRFFEPLVADWQREWAESSPAERAWIRARGTAAFMMAAFALTPRAVFLTPTPTPITRRILARMILFIGVVSGLLIIPFFTQLAQVPPGRLAWLVMWLVPSMVLLAFPFAMGFVVDGVRRHAHASPAERMAVVRTAILATAIMIVFGGWIVPAANQQFRVTVMADQWGPPARGARELTTLQLIRYSGLARAEHPRARAEAVQRELHNRASFAVLPIVLMWMRWRALGHPAPQWLLPAWLAAIVTTSGFFLLRWNDTTIESALGLVPGAGAWVPLAVFMLAGCLRDLAARRTPLPV